MTTDSVELFYEAVKKIEDARLELAKGATKSDHEVADAIFESMCAAYVQQTETVEQIRHLAMASLLYALAVLRQDMGVQAASKA